MITIYGSGDDNIVLEGDIDEELYAPSAGEHVLAFSDGSLLKVHYADEGLWRIEPIVIAAASSYSNVQASDPDENYSDRATLQWGGERIRWVVMADPSDLKQRVA